jgi:hypothetical protein
VLYDFIPELDLLAYVEHFAPDMGKLSPAFDVANQHLRLSMLPATGRISMAAPDTVRSYSLSKGKESS